MATRKKAAKNPSKKRRTAQVRSEYKAKHYHPTEEQVRDAVAVISRDYYSDVRAVGDSLAEQIEDGEITTREEFDQNLDQDVDGSARIIYTWQARLGLLATEHPDEYEEEFGNKPEGPEQALYAAMRRDVREYMDREYEDLLEGLEGHLPVPTSGGRTLQAAVLIARSISHNEIVHAPYSAELAEELILLADDYSEPGAGDIAGDYWGTTDSGAEWRVELDSEVAS